jgi:hypothetical protein
MNAALIAYMTLRWSRWSSRKGGVKKGALRMALRGLLAAAENRRGTGLVGLQTPIRR